MERTSKSEFSKTSHFLDCLALTGRQLFFVSDLHIHSKTDPKAQRLLKFVEALSADPRPKGFFLMGDVFDLWIWDHSVFQREYADLIQALRRFVSLGHQLFYFEGNHDLHLKEFWEGRIGAKVFAGPVIVEADGVSVALEHGDQMDSSDRGYLFLRWFLRTSAVAWILRVLPGRWIWSLGRKSSQASRAVSGRKLKESRKNLSQLVTQHVSQLASQSHFDFHISGHIHEPLDLQVSVGDRTIRAVNLGWWGGSNFANGQVAWFEGGKLTLEALSKSGVVRNS